MPPLPKNPATRQRRNKHSTARTLEGLPADAAVPALPKGRRWRAETKSWWADVWASPMASEFVHGRADIHGLFVLAVLVDDFWSEPTTALAAEIRLQRQCFGLTPIDRRRLQWEIERGEEATERTRRRRSEPTPLAAASEASASDPRAILHLA